MSATQRFSDRVDRYVAYRPTYPDGLFDALENAGWIGADKVVADIGAGTGIATDALAKRCRRVFAVEPNEPMRRAGEAATEPWGERVQWVHGTAETTGLDASSVDAIVAAQAFHWFEPAKAREEFLRIGGDSVVVALIWNARRKAGTAFLEAYEEALLRWGVDYAAVDHTGVAARARIEAFAAGAEVQRRQFANAQSLDWQGVVGRLESSSYVPRSGCAEYDSLVEHVRRGFDAMGGPEAEIQYDTELFVVPLNRG